MSAFWAENDYIGFFSKYSEPMIIDEVQRVPELLSAIQVKVDENRRMNGRFIITGSHQPRLREAVAQSLAGRTTIHTLLPLSYEEIKKTGRTDNLTTTLGQWLSVLEDSFIVFRLQPHFSNISKHIVKSPKVYFVEPGLAAYLLGIETPRQASRDPLRGIFFENIIVPDALKSILNDKKEDHLGIAG